MSKTKVCVLIPFTTHSACGKPHYMVAMYREQVTCNKCKDTIHFKDLPNIGKIKSKRSKK